MESVKIDDLVERLHPSFEADDISAAAKLIERRNVNVVQNALATLAVPDLDALLELTHPDVTLEIHAPDVFPFIRRAAGRAAVRAAMLHNFGEVQGQEPRMLRLVAQGDIVILSIQETGRIRCTQQTYDITGIMEFNVREGKIAGVREVIAFTAPA